MKYEYCSGAVLYTVVNDKILYVLVVESDGHCGLPKGHIETGETERETALREIKEETGINAVLFDDFAIKVEYETKEGSIKRTTYFIASYYNQVIECNNNELLEVKLLPFDEAMATLTYQDIKDVLQKANHFLKYTNDIPWTYLL